MHIEGYGVIRDNTEGGDPYVWGVDPARTPHQEEGQ